jgi:hypothetical protein
VPRVADSSTSLLFGTRRAVQGGQQRGARHAHLRTRKGCGPLARRKVLSLALSLTAALAWPVLALAQASDQAPPKPENVLPPDQPFERLIERNARYMSGVARRHGFPPSATLSSADKSFRRNLELCRFAHCARVSFRLFAPARWPCGEFRCCRRPKTCTQTDVRSCSTNASGAALQFLPDITSAARSRQVRSSTRRSARWEDRCLRLWP